MYSIRGQFLEACDCSLPCPCWMGEDADEQECAGVLAWHIEHGTIEGTDVSGLTAVSVSHHAGNRGTQGQHADMRVTLLIDDRSTVEQQEALARAFSGQLGGPLAELAEMAAQAPAIERVASEFASDGGTTSLSAGVGVMVSMKPLIGATKRITTIADSALSTLLGSVGEIGKTSVLRLELAEFDLTVKVSNRSAMRGRFSYMVDGDGPAAPVRGHQQHGTSLAESETRFGARHDPFG